MGGEGWPGGAGQALQGEAVRADEEAHRSALQLPPLLADLDRLQAAAATERRHPHPPFPRPLCHTCR